MADEAHSTVADGLKSPSPAWDCPVFPAVIEGWFGRPSPEIVQLWFERDAENEDSHVYFVRRATDNAIKIGYTGNIPTRMKILKQAIQCEIEILATTQGARSLEHMYHVAFAEHHISGEWFHPHPDILAEIDRLASIESNRWGLSGKPIRPSLIWEGVA